MLAPVSGVNVDWIKDQNLRIFSSNNKHYWHYSKYLLFTWWILMNAWYKTISCCMQDM